MDKEEIDVALEEKMALLADLDGTMCELDHSGDPQKGRKAVNYMMLKLVSGEIVALPVCEFCNDELEKGQTGDFEWYLLICTQCQSTKWLYKENCLNDYPKQVHFIKSCPECDFMYQNVITDTIN